MVLLGTATFATNDGITSLKIVSDFAGTGSINTTRNNTTIVKTTTGYTASFSGSLQTPSSTGSTYTASFTVTTVSGAKSGSISNGNIKFGNNNYSINVNLSSNSTTIVNIFTFIIIPPSPPFSVTTRIIGTLSETSEDNWSYRGSTTLSSLTSTYTQDPNLNQAIVTINSANSSTAKELFEFGCVFGADGAIDPRNPEGEAGSFDENTAIGGLLILILSIVSLPK